MLDIDAYKDAIWDWIDGALGASIDHRIYWIIRPEDASPPFIILDELSLEFTQLSGGWRADIDLTIRYYGRIGSADESDGMRLLNSLRSPARIMGDIIEIDRIGNAPTTSPDVFGLMAEASQVLTRIA